MEKLRTWVGSLFIAVGVWILPKETSDLFIMVIKELNKGMAQLNEKLQEQRREYYRGNN